MVGKTTNNPRLIFSTDELPAQLFPMVLLKRALDTMQKSQAAQIVFKVYKCIMLKPEFPSEANWHFM